MLTFVFLLFWYNEIRRAAADEYIAAGSRIVQVPAICILYVISCMKCTAAEGMLMKQLQKDRWNHGIAHNEKDRSVQAFLERTGTDDYIQAAPEMMKEDVLDKENLHAFLQEFAEKRGFSQTLDALAYAELQHEGQYRSGKKHIPYICHPMMVAVQAISMGFEDDSLLAACLLHDVLEDCGVEPDELPVADDTVKIVKLLTRDKETGCTESGRDAYYTAIAEIPEAVIVKLLDRSSNLSDMAMGFSRRKMLLYLEETKRWIYPLIEKAEEYYPEKRAQILTLKYHMISIQRTVERLGNENCVTVLKP